jgi:hypothetical protein
VGISNAIVGDRREVVEVVVGMDEAVVVTGVEDEEAMVDRREEVAEAVIQNGNQQVRTHSLSTSVLSISHNVCTPTIYVYTIPTAMPCLGWSSLSLTSIARVTKAWPWPLPLIVAGSLVCF